MTQTSEKLEPCPLPGCQGPAETGYRFIRCQRCGITLYALNTEEAIRRWNTRPASDKLREALKKVDEGVNGDEQKERYEVWPSLMKKSNGSPLYFAIIDDTDQRRLCECPEEKDARTLANALNAAPRAPEPAPDALREARNAALEEAAKIAKQRGDECSDNEEEAIQACDEIEKAIRALKPTTEG